MDIEWGLHINLRRMSNVNIEWGLYKNLRRRMSNLNVEWELYKNSWIVKRKLSQV
jgi:hypothetical protein